MKKERASLGELRERRTQQLLAIDRRILFAADPDARWLASVVRKLLKFNEPALTHAAGLLENVIETRMAQIQAAEEPSLFDEPEHEDK